MKLIVELESYALCGSGEGAGLIDSDVVHDPHGIPYLPGRRLKGLLRESALEVTEMLGMSSPALVDHIFGSDGFQPGIMQTPNLYPKGYDSWNNALQELLDAQDNTLVSPAAMLASFTTIRQQTAIDHDSGTAGDATLRVARMLNPGIVFEGNLTVTDPDSPVSALLWIAARNLRRFGTRRNRGQGTIRCTLSPLISWTVQTAIDEVTRWKTPTVPGKDSVVVSTPAEDNETARLEMRIKTLSPVVLAIQSGDQNTVETARAIPGSTLKGILVDRVQRALGLQKGKEHESSIFRSLFLEQGEKALFVTPAFPVIDGSLFTPAPFYLHQEKTLSGTVHNLLESRPANTNPVHGLIKLTAADGQPAIRNDEPDTTLFFHTQRAQDRKQGKSSDDDGAIFYYEALEKGQEFCATLHGPKGLLDWLLSLGASFTASIGRSRSAQYGQVQVTLAEAADADDDQDTCNNNQTLMTCLSPLILRNPRGFPEANVKNLEMILAKAIADQGVTVRVRDAFSRTTTVEQFVGVMGCRLPACDAYREGSSFLIEVSGIQPQQLAKRLETLNRQGLGEWRAMGYGAVLFSAPPAEKTFYRDSDVPSRKSLSDITLPGKMKDIVVGIIHREEETYAADQGRREAASFTGNGSGTKSRLNNHQIGRLESFVSNAESVGELQNSLGALRDTAKNKLRACRTKAGISILEQMTSFTGAIETHLAQFVEDHKRLLTAAGVAQSPDARRFQLAKIYWLALLRRLRKLNKEAN